MRVETISGVCRPCKRINALEKKILQLESRQESHTDDIVFLLDKFQTSPNLNLYNLLPF